MDTADMLTDEEPSSFTIPSVEGALQEDEVESSFKELQDWTRYIAQHKEQRQRLLSFTAQVMDSLKTLLGGEEGEKPASYAAAAATSAPRPRNPKKAGAAPTTKILQHAITRYERASKELPGAPRDTLLKVVTSSNLNTAPTPLLDAPKPKKKPACLIQGIRSNTVAVRLPDGVKVPPSLPAVIADANVNLKRMGCNERIKEIHYGIRRHLNLVFDQNVSNETRSFALNYVLGRFNAEPSSVTELERPTHSILKFTAVPTVSNNGTAIQAAHATALLRRHPAWADVEFLEEPRFVFPKGNPDPLCATLQTKIKDTRKATIAKKLLNTTVSFAGVVRRCQPWTVAPTARQCSTCLKWGHSAYVCRSRAPQCGLCAGNHLTALHSQHAQQCRSTSCTHTRVICANCNNDHEASSTSCPFFKARTSPGQLQQLQEQRVKCLHCCN